MTANLDLDARGADDAALGLTAASVARLAAFATLVWFSAALFIRFAGPAGVFEGARALILYAVTVPATVPLNRRTGKIAGLPQRRMVVAVAVTAATATLLDGIAMTLFPALYGGDPIVMLGGAVWLLWAIGVGLALALATSFRASRAP